MAYELRDRKYEKGFYATDSSSEAESDNSESELEFIADPNYISATAVRKQRNEYLGVRRHRPFTRRRRQSYLRMAASGSQNIPRRPPGRPRRRPVSDAQNVVRRPPGRPRTRPVPVQGNLAMERERKRSVASYIPRGRRNSTRIRPRSMFGENITPMSLLIDLDVVKENQRVQVCEEDTDKVAQYGRLTRKGLMCECCNEVFKVSDFIFHATGEIGDEDLENYDRVLLTHNRYSLIGCQFLAWVKIFAINRWNVSNEYDPNTGSDTSDDACLVCADGGDLLCCEKCPLTFHPICLGLESVPQDVWLCPFCVCKHCGRSDSGYKKMRQCRLCEKSYHIACGKDRFFCGDVCAELDRKMRRLVELKTDLGDGFSWTVLHHSAKFVDKSSGIVDVCTRIFGNSKVALAWILMDHSFEPIIDRLTNINLLRTVVYNNSSKFARIDFKGFYTLVLEKDDEMVAAASLRLRGKELAEMPFVATNWTYRNQGMLKKLMIGIESAMDYLEVENLVLPSAEDVEEMWINKFGFAPIDGPIEKLVARSKMLTFPKSKKLIKSFVQNDEQAEDENMGQQEVVENEVPFVHPFDLNFEPPLEEDEAMWRG